MALKINIIIKMDIFFIYELRPQHYLKNCLVDSRY